MAEASYARFDGTDGDTATRINCAVILGQYGVLEGYPVLYHRNKSMDTEEKLAGGASLGWSLIPAYSF